MLDDDILRKSGLLACLRSVTGPLRSLVRLLPVQIAISKQSRGLTLKESANGQALGDRVRTRRCEPADESSGRKEAAEREMRDERESPEAREKREKGDSSWGTCTDHNRREAYIPCIHASKCMTAATNALR